MINGTSLAGERDSVMGTATFHSVSDFFFTVVYNLCAINIALPEVWSLTLYLRESELLSFAIYL